MRKKQKVNDNNEKVIRQCSFAESYTIGLTDFDFLVFQYRIRQCSHFAKLKISFFKRNEYHNEERKTRGNNMRTG